MTTTPTGGVSFGIMTAQQQVGSPPAVLAKIATTVDIVSRGRLEFGIGVGSRPRPLEARREYPAHGLPFDTFARAVAGLHDRAPTLAYFN
ncbi:hypothetical protein [Mycobacteroides franklinii]|uniref:Luciferase-like monooxygenase n=1 Tax=Mycobacteroides franklinii TaxID=948102 RepID=A0A4R8R3C1_9MYCO|nr:hypothetical protein [Mycobacteroides franklinii]TDZ45188.1 Luciferase-like monooxygenase [Mycobacteroides franklinii]TDZ48679.1 Luciferase-like monooxygenase [Mycobacteroides franklinii]TDZ58860.1 Luciferase-like monooxygenase [Mycobacteroides franklinii]TDZ66374.1 Luciferase-like monooxygenase [Mycobacteroides franklinii]TDZ72297.1 Luciferase-like monooxygenase [Mycobacteroides franklinii]